MAIYEFKCPDCELIQEETHPMAEAPSEAICNKCEKTIKRHYGSCNFTLKGGGWPGKNIKQGVSPTADNKMEAELASRKKKGLKDFKEVPMSDEKVAEQKKLLNRYLDENPGK